MAALTIKVEVDPDYKEPIFEDPHDVAELIVTVFDEYLLANGYGSDKVTFVGAEWD